MRGKQWQTGICKSKINKSSIANALLDYPARPAFDVLGVLGVFGAVS
jgi:hypothetical protein